MIVKISELHIGQRVRDDYGDMESLANSIKEYGLLHPIVVDSNYNLIAGCRRLLACERIGMKEIEAKVLEDISEKELRALELEENIRRKDLTELEKSKNLVELAEIKKEKLKKIVMAEPAKTNRGGRPPASEVALKDIAESMCIPRKTLHDAKQHVAAVEEFPPLENLPKYQAIQTAKELRKAPPEEQEKILDFSQRKKQTLSSQKEEDFYTYMDECGKVTKKYHKAIYGFLELNADEKEFKMLSEIIIPQTAETYLREINDSINKLSRLKNFMKGVINNGKNKDIRNKG